MNMQDAEAIYRTLPDWALATGCLVAVMLAMGVLVWIGLRLSAAGARSRDRAHLRDHAALFEVQRLHTGGGIGGQRLRERRVELVRAR